MKKLFFLPVITLLLLMAVSAPGTAFAASSQQVHLQAHQARAAALVPTVTCSGNGCTGLDPIQTGCSASASTVLSIPIFRRNAGGVTPIGNVNLRFSSVCKTNWAQIVSSIGTVQMFAQVERASGSDGPLAQECVPDGCASFITNSAAFTDMVWAPDVPAQAVGSILLGGSQFFSCVTQSQSALPCS